MRLLLHHFDHSLATFIQRWRWPHRSMLIMTHWGRPIVVIGLVVAVIIFGNSLVDVRLLLSLGMVIIMLGISTLLKAITRRARPVTRYAAQMKLHSYSFPSGHTVGSTVLYGLFAYLAWMYVSSPLLASVIGVLCIGIIIIVGISRVYLGAHFPSDVIGGWLLGIFGLLVITVYIGP